MQTNYEIRPQAIVSAVLPSKVLDMVASFLPALFYSVNKHYYCKSRSLLLLGNNLSLDCKMILLGLILSGQPKSPELEELVISYIRNSDNRDRLSRSHIVANNLFTRNMIIAHYEQLRDYMLQPRKGDIVLSIIETLALPNVDYIQYLIEINHQFHPNVYKQALSLSCDPSMTGQILASGIILMDNLDSNIYHPGPIMGLYSYETLLHYQRKLKGSSILSEDDINNYISVGILATNNLGFLLSIKEKVGFSGKVLGSLDYHQVVNEIFDNYSFPCGRNLYYKPSEEQLEDLFSAHIHPRTLTYFSCIGKIVNKGIIKGLLRNPYFAEHYDRLNKHLSVLS